MSNLWEKQNATIKVKSGSGWGNESWKERLKVFFVLHKSKLLKLIRWGIVLIKLVKLHVASFATKIVKVSHISFTPAFIWRKNNTNENPLVTMEKFHLECNTKWYEHVRKSVLENEGRRILWNLLIQTDKVIHHRRPNIVCIAKIAKSCTLAYQETKISSWNNNEKKKQLSNY